MTGANLSGAIIRRAYIGNVTGFTAAQLYATASYQSRDLSGTAWYDDNLGGWNFSGQNLQKSVFSATITGADFSAADTRGVGQFDADVPINTNLIRPDGSIHGLQLTAGKGLIVRDFDEDQYYPSTPIRVENILAMDTTGSLRIELGSDAWGSLISFAPGIAVTLGGTLELDFAAGVNAVDQVGRTFHVFDWSGVSPMGSFSVSSPYAWNLSHLYTTGEITFGAPNALGGDFNYDGTVDAGDYVAWRKRGSAGQDFDTWRNNFGAILGGTSTSASRPLVPEPTAMQLIGALILCVTSWSAWRGRTNAMVMEAQR
jgi:hypothetical protein